jgi:uroporphyrinogen III methyltransferase/synthase
MKGRVYIVGAGPGDIGLLTLKGLHYLKLSDVVVYDFHLNAQMLNYINNNAEFIYAGKRGGHHTMTQTEINKCLVEKALEGKTVCRLKGGDPFVFGRGGEEIQELIKEGIDFEIVPGISSAVAAPAYAGIPLTHRLFSSSVAIITGCESPLKQSSVIQWDKIATGIDTLVFLMAIRNISCITENLLYHGKDPNTPVAVIRWGTRPEQNAIVGTLSTIVDLLREKNLKPPAVVVVGNVVKLRDEMMWYEKKPLFGHRILITRQYTEKYEPLETLGAEIIELPTIEIVPPQSFDELDSALSQIETCDWLIFTSANGVKFFFNRYRELNKDIRDLKGIKICSIGPATAKEIKKYGINVDLTPETFNAEGLVSLFPQVTGKKFLLPRAEDARDVFPNYIRHEGGIISAPSVYRAIKPIHHSKLKRLKRFLQEGRITIATFTSAATFTNFIEIVGDDAEEFLHDVLIVAIGPVTAEAIKKAGLPVHIIPEKATINSMVQAIIDKCTKSPARI